MKRILKYGIEGHDKLIRLEFEDCDVPIIISGPNKPNVKISCGDKTILSLTGIRLSYIELI